MLVVTSIPTSRTKKTDILSSTLQIWGNSIVTNAPNVFQDKTSFCPDSC